MRVSALNFQSAQVFWNAFRAGVGSAFAHWLSAKKLALGGNGVGSGIGAGMGAGCGIGVGVTTGGGLGVVGSGIAGGAVTISSGMDGDIGGCPGSEIGAGVLVVAQAPSIDSVNSANPHPNLRSPHIIAKSSYVSGE